MSVNEKYLKKKPFAEVLQNSCLKNFAIFQENNRVGVSF